MQNDNSFILNPKFSFLLWQTGIFFVTQTHDGVTKKMSLHFFQYSCRFAGFWTENPKNGFTVDVQTANRSKIRYSGASA